MIPSEMEEQIKNLNQWAGEVAQYLPLRATKEDLKALATKEELREAVAPLASKQFVLDLIQVTRREIRQVDNNVTAVGEDVKGIAEQVAKLSVQIARLGWKTKNKRPT